MSTNLPNKAQFDALLPELQALARDWAERECTSFDAAVRRAAGDDPDEGSMWDMPAIDSKRAVLLLVEFEGLIGGGCELPVAVIKPGGYGSAADLIAKLLPRLRERCPDEQRPGIANVATPVRASALPPPQVLP